MTQKRFHHTLNVAVLLLCASSHLRAAPSVVDVSGGDNHRCAVFSDGSAKCWGSGFAGQLGHGKSEITNKPVLTYTPTNDLKVIKVSAANLSTCLLFSNGKVKCFGSNQKGNLGLGHNLSVGWAPNQTVDQLPFLNLGSDGNKVVEVSHGDRHSCVLFESGEIKCWGENHYGQLGLGDREHRGFSEKHMGDNLPYLSLGGKATGVCVRGSYTCALMESGQPKCFGSGRLGNNKGTDPSHMGENLKAYDMGTNKKITKMNCLGSGICSHLDDGSVKCFGGGGPVLGQGNNMFFLPEEWIGDTLPALDLGSLETVDLACGNSHCCAIGQNHAIRCWGSNRYGQLGFGSPETAWGNHTDHMGDGLRYVDLGSFVEVDKVFPMAHGNCALSNTGKLKCWGRMRSKSKGDYNIGLYSYEMGYYLYPMNFN